MTWSITQHFECMSLACLDLASPPGLFSLSLSKWKDRKVFGMLISFPHPFFLSGQTLTLDLHLDNTPCLIWFQVYSGLMQPTRTLEWLQLLVPRKVSAHNSECDTWHIYQHRGWRYVADGSMRCMQVHFSHPFLGTYEVVQFLELANLEGIPFQSGMTSIPIPSYHGMETTYWYHTIPTHTIPYHTIPTHTIPYHDIPYHHSKPVTGCLGSFLQNIKNISAGCNTDPLGSIFCGLVL